MAPGEAFNSMNDGPAPSKSDVLKAQFEATQRRLDRIESLLDSLIELFQSPAGGVGRQAGSKSHTTPHVDGAASRPSDRNGRS